MGIMLYLSQVADGGIELFGIPLVANARDEAGRVAGAILTFRLALALATVGFTIGLAFALLPSPDDRLLALFAFGLLATALSVRWVHLGLERPIPVAAGRVLGEAAFLGLTVWWVRGAGDTAWIAIAQTAGVFLTTAYLLVALARSGIAIEWRWAPREATPVWRRSSALIVFTLLGLLLFNFDLLFLRFRVGAREAGLYAAAYTFIAFAANLVVAFAQTVLATLAKLTDRPAERLAVYHTATAQAFAIALPVGVGAWFVAPLAIQLLFGSAYEPGSVALRWLAWAIPLAALRELPVAALIGSRRERALLRINAWTALANVSLVIVAVPRFGLEGAAAATVATEFLRLALAVKFSAESGFTRLPVIRLAKPLLASVALGVVLVAVDPQSIFVAAPLGIATYAVALVLLRVLRFEGHRPVLSV